MVEQLMNYKKRLYRDFIKVGKTPYFTDGQYVKIKVQWTDFKAYKESKEALQKSRKI